jgi:DNA helicase HerA-like ATPase
LQKIAESFSKIGVPVFMADIKGDLSGISQRGSEQNPKITDRLKTLGISGYTFNPCPATFWDVFAEQGHPLRATISEMGPLLLSRMLNLNDVQAGVLMIAFKIADDNGFLLLDLRSLRSTWIMPNNLPRSTVIYRRPAWHRPRVC